MLDTLSASLAGRGAPWSYATVISTEPEPGDEQRVRQAEMLSVLDEVQQQLRTIARVQRERAELTATATVRRQVTMPVNADGVVIETEFGPGIEDLTYQEIARAVTEAAQQAAAEVARRGRELMSPVQDR